MWILFVRKREIYNEIGERYSIGLTLKHFIILIKKGFFVIVLILVVGEASICNVENVDTRLRIKKSSLLN
jgi:hypothetical protein